MATAKPVLIPLLALALAAPLVPGAALAGGYGNADRLSGYHRDGRHGYGWHDDRRPDGHNARHNDRHHVRHQTRHRHPAPRPHSYVRIWLGDGLALYWGDGFVGPHGHDHLVVTPAIGMRVGHVPAGYVSFVIGPSRYFFVSGAYYVWDDRHRDYLVVPKPRGADAAMRGARAEREDFLADAAFDRAGAVGAWDRNACDAWAASETGGVERAAPGSPARKAYLNAMEACLEGRGYPVK
jgi:hypothetical protein